MRCLILSLLIMLSGCGIGYVKSDAFSGFYGRIWKNEFNGLSVQSGNFTATLDSQKAGGLSPEEMTKLLSIMGAI